MEQLRNPRLSRAQGNEKALRTADGKDMVGIMDEVPEPATAYREPRDFPIVKSSRAWEAIEAAASNIAKSAKIRTRQQAIAEVLRTRHDLVRAYDRERQRQLVG